MASHASLGFFGMIMLATFTTGCFHHQAKMDEFERRVADRCVEAAAASRPAVYVIPGGAVTPIPPAVVPVAPAAPR